MGEHFDQLSRVLATPMERRRAFKLGAGAVAGGVAAALLPGRAQAGINPCAGPGGSACPPAWNPPFEGACCTSGVCCPSSDIHGAGSLCCAPDTVCVGAGTASPQCVGTGGRECPGNTTPCFPEAPGQKMKCCPANHACCEYRDKNGKLKLKCCPPGQLCDPFEGCFKVVGALL